MRSLLVFTCSFLFSVACGSLSSDSSSKISDHELNTQEKDELKVFSTLENRQLGLILYDENHAPISKNEKSPLEMRSAKVCVLQAKGALKLQKVKFHKSCCDKHGNENLAWQKVSEHCWHIASVTCANENYRFLFTFSDGSQVEYDNAGYFEALAQED